MSPSVPTLPLGSQKAAEFTTLGYLELNGVLLTDNQAPSGGGISNRNTLTVTASSIIANTSSGLGGGHLQRHGEQQTHPAQ